MPISSDQNVALQSALDADIAYLALQGYSTWAISKELGVSAEVVGQRLVALQDEWRRMASQAIEEHAGRALALAMTNIRYAYESFELSKKPKKRTRIIAEKVSVKGESRMVPNKQEITEEENPPGDPRWLMVIDSSLRTIIKIVGIEKAAQLTAQFTTNITQINAAGNADELHERARRFAEQFGLTVEQYANIVSDGLRHEQSLDSQVGDPYREAIDVSGGPTEL